MTLEAIGTGMGSCQREGRHAVIEHIIRTTSRVAYQTGGTVVRITGYAIVHIVRFRIHVAGGAGEFGVIGRIGVAVDACIPFALVLAAEDGEVLTIMIKG